MDAVNHLLQLPYMYVVLPVLVFLTIAGSFCWALRPGMATAAREATGENDGAGESATAAFLVQEKPTNQRATSRRIGNPVEVYVAPPEGKKNPSTGSVLDRSLGGLRLAVFQETPVGSVLSVRPVEAEAMVPWVDIQVRSCKVSQEMPGLYEVGCEYVKSPPYSIQLLFG